MSFDRDSLANAIAEAAPRSEVARDAPIGARTTYRVGGAAAIEVLAPDVDSVRAIADVVSETGPIPIVIIGKGSNMLVADSGFDGIALVLGAGFDYEQIDGDVVVAGGSRMLPVLARATVAASLTGFEWAVGVPGSVGGAVRMNAGGHGSDMSASLVEATVLDLLAATVTDRAADSLDFGYRHSSLERHEVVVQAKLQLAHGDKAMSEGELREIVRWRRENQPGGQNAGSVFTNPPGDSAGRLIDEAGLKGLKVGTAEVSTKHANFIQASDGGKANDIYELMLTVIDRVRQHSGVELSPETHLVGFEVKT